jgi:hypothetical protein
MIMLARLRLLFAIVIGLAVLAACGTQVDPAEGFDLTVTVQGNGSVVSNPAGINTSDTQTVAFSPNAVVTLNATHAEGHRFVSWGGDCDGTTCILTMTQDRNVTATFEAVAADGGTTITRTLAANTDDAEEFLADSLLTPTSWRRGYTFITSSGLELGYDPTHGPQVVGLRFTGINLPAGAQITSARLNFTARTDNGTTGTGNPVLAIRAQNSITAPTFAAGTVGQAGNFDITNRPLLAASVPWTITETWVAGTTYASPNLANLLQEVVDLGDWGPTNAVVFVIEGDPNSTAFRRAVSRDTDPARAVTLTIEYTLP